MSCCGRSGQRSSKSKAASSPPPPPANNIAAKVQQQINVQQGGTQKPNYFNFHNRYKGY